MTNAFTRLPLDRMADRLLCSTTVMPVNTSGIAPSKAKKAVAAKTLCFRDLLALAIGPLY
jgi:hypothetical protein